MEGRRERTIHFCDSKLSTRSRIDNGRHKLTVLNLNIYGHVNNGQINSYSESITHIFKGSREGTDGYIMTSNEQENAFWV